MSYEEKLKKEKLKKFAVGIGLIAVIGLGGGLFYFSSHQHSKSLDISNITDKSLAKFIILGNSEGKVNLIDTFKQKDINKFNLPKGDYKFCSSNNYKYMLAINKNTGDIYKLNESNLKIKKEKLTKIKDLSNLSNIKDLKTDEDILAISFTNDNNILTINLKTGLCKKINIATNTEAWSIKENKIIFSENEKIKSIDILNDKTKDIDVGDKSVGMTLCNNKLLVFNKFGSGLNKSIALKINISDLKIDDIIKYESKNIYKINADNQKDSFLTLVENNNSQILERVSINGDNKVLSETSLQNKIKLDKDAVGINNYLYYKEQDKLNILSCDTGAVNYSIDLHDSYYMPIE